MFFGQRKSFTRMLNPLYQLIADAYHIPYQVVIDRADLKPAIEKMLATDGPCILECAVKEEDNVAPMIAPVASIDEMMLEIDIKTELDC